METLSFELVEFLNKYIKSIRQLEALLFFHSNREEEFSVEKVTRFICSNDRITEKWVEEFHSNQFLKRVQKSKVSYQYGPSTIELDGMISQLANEYKVRPLRVINVIVNRPTKQMMNFMEAFNIGSEKKNDDK